MVAAAAAPRRGTEFERAYWSAWAPPDRLAPSAWAERWRTLTRRESLITGRWRNDNAPYLAGIMDMTADPRVEELTVVKAGQVGVSEAIRNALGCMAQQDGDPVLIVLPDQHVGEKIFSERLTPFFRSTPCLAELLSERAWDVTNKSLGLMNGFKLRLGWSGSPATQASDPYRWVINDEVDKFREWSGKEADPISLGRVRTQTYGLIRKIINVSTPTTRNGLITREYDACATRMHYEARCPKCGRMQAMTFDRLRWETPAGLSDAGAADAVMRDGTAWYECIACKARWGESERAVALRDGCWTSDDGGPPGARVGMRVGTLECMWVRMAAIAAEFLRSRGDAARMQNFRNSWLGEVFEQLTASVKTGVFSEKSAAAAAAGYRPREVPAWAGRLIATCDVQQDRLYVVLRAWGPQLRSRRIWHGTVLDFDELRRICFELRYPALDGGPAWRCDLLGVDCGYRSDEVYRFALRDPTRIKPLKGAGPDANAEPGEIAGLRDARTLLRLVEPRKISYAPRERSPYDVWINLVDVGRCKDWLAAAVEAVLTTQDGQGELSECAQWELNDEDDPVYNAQMASEHKVLLRRAGRRVGERWIKKTSGAANHFWDCEVYQRAMAFVAHVDLMQDDDLRPSSAGQPPRVSGGIDGLRGGGWISQR